MATSRSLLPTLAFIFGCFLISSGALGILYPLWLAQSIFAIPTATQETIAFYPGLAGRNLSGGLTVMSLLYMGRPCRKALGAMLFSLLANGFSDVYLLAIHPDGTGFGPHYFNILLIGSTGLGLMLGY